MTLLVKDSFPEAKSIRKKTLWFYVNRKIDYAITRFHTLAVIELLIEEMIKDLMDDKVINIHNFGRFFLITPPPRKRYFNIQEQTWKNDAKPKRLIRFDLMQKLVNKLTSNIDHEATFKTPKA